MTCILIADNVLKDQCLIAAGYKKEPNKNRLARPCGLLEENDDVDKLKLKERMESLQKDAIARSVAHRETLLQDVQKLSKAVADKDVIVTRGQENSTNSSLASTEHRYKAALQISTNQHLMDEQERFRYAKEISAGLDKNYTVLLEEKISDVINVVPYAKNYPPPQLADNNFRQITKVEEGKVEKIWFKRNVGSQNATYIHILINLLTPPPVEALKKKDKTKINP